MLQHTLRAAYRERWAYLFLAVPCGLLTVFYLVPIAWAFTISFSLYLPGTITWVGLSNYARVLRDDIFWLAMRNTVLYTLATVVVGLALSLGLAWLIFQIRGRALQTFFKAAFYLPGVASLVSLAMVWAWIFQPAYGLANYLLALVGLPAQTWLASASLALPSLILMNLMSGQGPAIVLLVAAMGSIPDSLYEAARIDGANKWVEFTRVTVPLLRPTILYLIVVGTISAMQVFTQIWVMTQGGPGYATNTVVYRIYKTAFELFDFGQASAMALFLFIILTVAALVQYRFLGSEVEY